ncbi:GDSL-like Lipase/Acylhydrolase [Cyathus striatus]|nr:GDSL-like Lipase/Acylhydrolase [Cyathus striatus]
MGLSSLIFASLAAVGLLANSAVCAGPPARPNAAGHWVDTWVTMPQLTELANLPPPPFNQTGIVFKNSTIRQTIHTSIGADQIRLRISNVFGGSDLPITAVTVALPAGGLAGTSAIQPGTLQTVTFSGNGSVVIPNGALVVSDPVTFSVKPQSMLTVTLYTAQGQTTNSITSHPGSRTTTFFTFGNSVSATNLTGASNVAHWYFLSALEAWAPPDVGALAIVGDSITDGTGSTNNANNRSRTSQDAKQPCHKNIAVVNQAAGGNRILADGSGPNALGRIDRDVLAQSGVKYAMIFEGVNDIGTAPATVADQQAIGDRVIWSLKQIATRVHTLNIPMFAATITPFSGNASIQRYSSPIREATRTRVNDFIRNSGTFDAVIDFDKILADPAIPSQLNPKFDSGDFLHPNPAGYQAIADAFPLDIFDIKEPRNNFS